MARFEDLMAAPLPSQLGDNPYNESAEDDYDSFDDEDDTTDEDGDIDSSDDADTECGGKGCDTECGGRGCDTECGDCQTEDGDEDDPASIATNDDDEVPDDVDDILSGMDDAELDNLMQNLDDDQIDNIAGDVEDVADLSPEADAEADDMMALAATSQLVNDELEDSDSSLSRELAESVNDLAHAVNEGLMTEGTAAELSARLNGEVMTEKKWFATKQRIELGREAKMKQLYSLAVFVEARAHNDADWKKLQKVYRMRRILRARLVRKYDAAAKRRMRVYVERLKKSKSGVFAKLGQKLFKKNK